MRKRGAAHTILPFARFKQQQVDWLEIMHHRHTVHALIETDITETRQAIRAYRARHDAPLSLTAYVIVCVARAIDANRLLHAYRQGRGRMILFHDVDVTATVEHRLEAQRIPTPHIIRAANRKSFDAVERELRAAQAQRLPHPRAMRLLPLWLLVPAPLRRFVWSRILSDPFRRKRMTGTVMVTPVGMFGRGVGWGIPNTPYTLCVTVGGVSSRPGLVDGQLVEREYLHLTLSVDHVIVDGAILARFAQHLKELIEPGEKTLGLA